MLNQVQHDIFSLRHPELTSSYIIDNRHPELVSGSHSKKTPQGDKKIKPWGVPVFTKTRSII